MFQIAAICTNPFDVVKTHQQIELGEKEIYSGNNLIRLQRSQSMDNMKIGDKKKDLHINSEVVFTMLENTFKKDST